MRLNLLRGRGLRRAMQHSFGQATQQFRRLPDFVVIGAQRAGTTTLFNILSEHESSRPSWTKEVHYLDYHYHRGEGWYRSHFSLRSDGFAFEATPSLLYLECAPSRFSATLPGAKAVALLRDPARRALSHWVREHRLGRENRPFEEAFWSDSTKPDDAYRSRGLYAEQIERWHQQLGPERVVVLVSEEMYRNPDIAVNYLLRELNYPSMVVSSIHLNQQVYTADIPPSIRDYYGPHNQRLSDLLRRAFPWSGG